MKLAVVLCQPAVDNPGQFMWPLSFLSSGGAADGQINRILLPLTFMVIEFKSQTLTPVL